MHRVLDEIIAENGGRSGMRMLVTTKLPIDIIEPALTHMCEESNSKTFGMSNSTWEKQAEGKYIVSIIYSAENSWSNKKLRKGAEDSLRKKDPTGTVELMEEKKDVSSKESTEKKKSRFKFW